MYFPDHALLVNDHAVGNAIDTKSLAGRCILVQDHMGRKWGRDYLDFKV